MRHLSLPRALCSSVMEQRRRIAHFAGVAAPHIAIKRCATLGDDRFLLTPLSPANPRAERNSEYRRGAGKRRNRLATQLTMTKISLAGAERKFVGPFRGPDAYRTPILPVIQGPPPGPGTEDFLVSGFNCSRTFVFSRVRRYLRRPGSFIWPPE